MNISEHPLSQIPFDFWLAMLATFIVIALVIFLVSVLIKPVKSFFRKHHENRQNEVVKHDLD